MRGVPDVVNPQQGRQRDIPQRMPAIGQVREPAGKVNPCRVRPCRRRRSDRPAELAIGRLPADAVEIGQQHGRLAARSDGGDAGDLLVGQLRVADPVPPDARRRRMGDEDGVSPSGAVTPPADQAGRDAARAAGFVHREAGDETFPGMPVGCNT